MEQQIETVEAAERAPVARRTLLKGAAWSVPAVMVVGATPAFAQTGGTATFTFDTLSPTYLNLDTLGTTAVVAEGTVTPSGTVAIVINNGTADVINTNAEVDGTSWSYSIANSDLSEAAYSITASAAGGSATKYFYKDLQRPTPTIFSNVLTNSNGRAGTIVVTLGTAQTVTKDKKVVSFSSTTTGFNITGNTYDENTGRSTITWTSSTGKKGVVFTITQEDEAGNKGTVDGTVPQS